jgi:hypothetical protein
VADWYYNSRTGSVVEGGTPGAALDLLPEALHAGVGWHGPFGSKQAALDYYSSNAAANPGWKAPAGIASNVKNDVTTAPGAAASAAGQGLSKLGGALSWTAGISGISGHNLLVRSLKIIFGGLLLVAGIMHMTGTDKDAAGLLTRTAGKLPGI